MVNERASEMYVLCHSATVRDEFGDLHGPWVTELVEMSAAMYRESIEDPRPLIVLERVCPVRARQWVRDGGHHMTALYVDHDGRVRYARDK